MSHPPRRALAKDKAKFIRQKKDKHVQALLTRYAWLLPLGVIAYDIR
jgi:hypothetical protein